MDTTLVSNAKIATFPLYTHSISKRAYDAIWHTLGAIFASRKNKDATENKYGDICFVRKCTNVWDRKTRDCVTLLIPFLAEKFEKKTRFFQ